MNGSHPPNRTETDRITLTGLRVLGRHGVYDEERTRDQEFVIDATVWLDLAAAAATDDLSQTLDYGLLAQHAARVVSGQSCNLIETLAARIARAVLSDHRVEAVEVTVHKPSAPIPLAVGDVAVTLRLDRGEL